MTPVDADIARPLIEGLSSTTIVTDETGMSLFDIQPAPLIETLRKARTEEIATAAERSRAAA